MQSFECFRHTGIKIILYRHLRHVRAIAASSVYEELTTIMSEDPHLCATLMQDRSPCIPICVYLFVYTHIPTHVSYLIGSLGKYCSLIFSSESI